MQGNTIASGHNRTERVADSGSARAKAKGEAWEGSGAKGWAKGLKRGGWGGGGAQGSELVRKRSKESQGVLGWPHQLLGKSPAKAAPLGRVIEKELLLGPPKQAD